MLRSALTFATQAPQSWKMSTYIQIVSTKKNENWVDYIKVRQNKQGSYEGHETPSSPKKTKGNKKKGTQTPNSRSWYDYLCH